MIKKGGMFFVLSVFLILICGCETAKGALKGGVEGAKKDWETTKDVGTATVKGVGMAVKGAGTALMGADEWIRKNLW